MHSAYPTIESRLIASHAASDPAASAEDGRRRLGRVYRLILSYEPQEKASSQDEARDAPLRVDAIQSVAGL
jgi:hypothetical protein